MRAQKGFTSGQNLVRPKGELDRINSILREFIRLIRLVDRRFIFWKISI